MKTVFSGRARFTITVKPDLSATDTGTWMMTMKGSGPVTSLMKGTAGLTFRHAGSEERIADLYVNGVKVASNIEFASTGSPG